jgi:hypothetical protein
MALLQPRREAYYQPLLGKRDRYFRVKVGHRAYVESAPEARSEMELTGQLSVTDVLDVCVTADRFYGEFSFTAVAAEALGRPHTVMFPRVAQRTPNSWVSHMTPARQIHKPELATVVYDD